MNNLTYYLFFTFTNTICRFLENGNRYEVDIFSVHLYFNELSKNISHIVVAQNFIISTCLRMSTYTDFVNFLEEFNRYEAEILTSYLIIYHNLL